MVLFFCRLYELGAEEAAGGSVVVVGRLAPGGLPLSNSYLSRGAWRRTRYAEEGGGDLLKAAGEGLKLFALEAGRSAQKSGITYICVATQFQFQSTDVSRAEVAARPLKLADAWKAEMGVESRKHVVIGEGTEFDEERSGRALWPGVRKPAVFLFLSGRLLRRVV